MELVLQLLVDFYWQQQQFLQRLSYLQFLFYGLVFLFMNKVYGGMNKLFFVNQLVGQFFLYSLVVIFNLGFVGFGMFNNYGYVVLVNGEMISSYGIQFMVLGFYCILLFFYYVDFSFVSFLIGLGCLNCIEYFMFQGLQSIYYLQNLIIEDLGVLKIFEQYCMIIWWGLQDLKQGYDYGVVVQQLFCFSNVVVIFIGGFGELQCQWVMEVVYFCVCYIIIIFNCGGFGVGFDEWVDFGFDLFDCKVCKQFIKEEFMEVEIY